MDALTLDQFATFAIAAEEGSFAAAARRMGRAQSAITYTIRKLEDQSGAALFDRAAYRPRLTEAGQLLLPHARRILADLGQYRAQAKAMAAGVEAEVRLAVPESMPTRALIAALAALRTRFPSVQVRMGTDSTTSALRQLTTSTVDVAIVLDRIDLPDWFRRFRCGQAQLIAVTSPDHPLAALQSPIAPEVLADHLQIVVASRRGEDAGPDHGVVAANRWYVTDHAIKRELLLAALGWGGMPSHLVEQDVARGKLIRLSPLSWDGAAVLPDLPFVVGTHVDHAPGPAARAFIDAVRSIDQAADGA